MLSKTLFCAVLVTGLAVTFSSPAEAAKVLIVKGSFYTTDLANQLTSSGNTVTELTSYDAATLAAYDAVIHYGNNFVDQAALATFVNSGGNLIWTPWAGLNFRIDAPLQIFANGGRLIFSQLNPSVNVLSPGDPLLAGVSFPAADTTNIGRTSDIDFVAGVTQVADWSDGVGLVGHRSLGTGNVIGVNMQVITSDTAYQVINQPFASQLFNNAVNFKNVGAVPEPSTWAFMLVGFGAIGFGMRRRRGQKVTVRYAM